MGVYSELYHHGIKGQKWGVRRQQKLSARKKKRYDDAERRIQAHRTKSAAVIARAGTGTLRYLGQNWLASGAALTTMGMAMNAVNPPAAAIAFAATAAISLSNTGLNIENAYRTGRDIYDIAKHSDFSDYLMHYGIKGQRWGIRRFQDESGALTRLGKQRAELDSDWHPIKKSSSGDFMQDLHDDIAAVNHNGSSNELGRGTNCVYCTTAYEMRRRGYDVQAQQDWVGGIRGDMPAAMFEGAKTETAFDLREYPLGSEERNYMSAAATSALMESIAQQGDGARGYVSVKWAGGLGGHSMAYEVVEGEMHLIDCQTGDDLTDSDIWTERLIYADVCKVTRVDNCKMKKELVDRYIEDVGTNDSNTLMDDVIGQVFDKVKRKLRKSKATKQFNRYKRELRSAVKDVI